MKSWLWQGNNLEIKTADCDQSVVLYWEIFSAAFESGISGISGVISGLSGRWAAANCEAAR